MDSRARVGTGTDETDSLSKNADDVVITLAIRTPLTKAKKGGFKDTTLEYMLYATLKEVKDRCGFDAGLIEDICFGNVRPEPPIPRRRRSARQIPRRTHQRTHRQIDS